MIVSVRKSIALAVVAIMLLVSIAVPVMLAPGNAEAAVEVTMTIGVLQGPDTLNPFSMILGFSYTILFLMYDTLNSVETDFSADKQLAQSWYHSEDGKVWYYNITHDAVWHDGVALTAEDINFTYNLVLDNENACSLWSGYLTDFEEVVALSDYQLRITTTKAKATMLSIMVPILPKHIWADIPANQLKQVDYWKDSTYFPTGPVGSGPLVLDGFVQDDFVRMLKWDKYFIDVVNVDEVLYKIYETSEQMATALRSEYIDVAMGILPSSWVNTISAPNIDGQVVPQLSLYELGINCASAEWREAFPKASDNLETTNLAVRQAIAMCVNTTELVKTCMGGYADAGTSLIPTATPFWHYYVPPEEDWGFNLQGARDLLTAAGYEDIDGDDIRENTSSEVELTFVFNYRQNVLAEELAAEKISDWLWEVGINAPPVGLQESQLTNAWFGCTYDMYIWGWDADVDPSFMLSVMTTSEIPTYPQDYLKWSDCYYSNPVYDQMYIDQQNAVDLADRQTIIHDMQRILYVDCPYIVLWYPSGLYAYRTDTFYNYPDMEANPGSTPGTMWFFFDVLPYGEDMNLQPEVDLGPDQDIDCGQSMEFTGSALASDPNTGDILTYVWTFVEPDETESEYKQESVTYTFLNPGEVTVTLTVTDSGGLSASDSLVMTVTEVSETAGWVSGYVKTSSEAPIAAATITAGGKTSATDSQGKYNMSLEPGEYEVTASASGYAASSEDVTVETVTITWQNFTLASTTGNLQGWVLDDETGEGISGASVKVGTKMTITNETGYYLLTKLAAGTVFVNTSMAGYEANRTTAVIVLGGTTTLNVTLTMESTETGGLGTIVAVALGVIALAMVAAVVMTVIKKRKRSGDDDSPPPEEGS
ncbi:MAG: ABC transporter substrate-binding protein [Thermoplasmata archaeon]|nr:ABC transporter substrate-binding protein [Thermoplasmata archaeon]